LTIEKNIPVTDKNELFPREFPEYLLYDFSLVITEQFWWLEWDYTLPLSGVSVSAMKATER
jgi:hypothetical protein